MDLAAAVAPGQHISSNFILKWKRLWNGEDRSSRGQGDIDGAMNLFPIHNFTKNKLLEKNFDWVLPLDAQCSKI